MCSNIKYFITGGGTGGHIYPAMAVIDELVKSGVNKKDIFYVGNKNNLEYQIATSKDLNFLSYNVSGMPRKISFKLFLFIISTALRTRISVSSRGIKTSGVTLKYSPIK